MDCQNKNQNWVLNSLKEDNIIQTPFQSIICNVHKIMRNVEKKKNVTQIQKKKGVNIKQPRDVPDLELAKTLKQLF